MPENNIQPCPRIEDDEDGPWDAGRYGDDAELSDDIDCADRILDDLVAQVARYGQSEALGRIALRLASAPAVVDDDDEPFEPRSLDELPPIIDRLIDQVWYNRHQNFVHALNTGQVEIVETYRPDESQTTIMRSVWEGAQKAAVEVGMQFNGRDLGPWSDFEWGMLNGKLSALRWVLGDAWDMLDT